ncbi:MAG TPA: dihydrolipoamide acetyltransferase family protein [Candidatus Elarobacter sp.]|jgi:pyruvate dehydrogenase E2 component (dihydrolipoamide acetyltransferase)
MPVEVVMPKLGLTMASGTIARWIKRPGEAVRAGEPLVEVATDKITYEVESPASGTVARALGSDGDEFACGDVIGTIAVAGEPDTPVAASPPPDAAAAAPPVRATSTAPDMMGSDGGRIVEAPRIPAGANGVAPTVPADSHAAAPERAPGGATSAESSGARVVASPAARRLAREHGIALDSVRGTGPRGRITMADVIALRQSEGDGTARHDVSNATRHPVTLSLSKGEIPPRLPRSRRAIYGKMTEVGQLPLAQVETVARADAVKALIERRKDFGWTAFAVYAVARLLREHAELRTDATTGGPFERIDVGVAADTPYGLIVPVVRGAEMRSLAEIQTEIVRLAALARDGGLSPDDVGGACFSISNVGPQGVERVAPLPDPPQTAILGIGAATQRPAVADGAVVPAWMMTCVLSFDHRFIDGAPAARFLAAFARAFADPGVLL